MNETPVFGTGIGPGNVILVRRITDAGDLRITDEGDVRVVEVRSTVTVPQYLVLADVPSDGGEPFGFRFTNDPFQPPAPDGSVQGGESVFRWLYLTMAWSVSGQIKVTPFTDGNADDIVMPNGDVLQVVTSTFNLVAPPVGANRVNQIFPIPIRRRMVRDGVAIQRFAQRGERVQFLIESVGALSVGELLLQGIELESSPVRKSKYAVVTN